MDSKRKANFAEQINKIKRNSFDEKDLKILLIDIRENLKEESFLREVCDFIAHPSRDKGICYKTVNSRYAKYKFASEGADQMMKNLDQEKDSGKPWSFFSDQILGYINTRSIDSKLFEILILDGIEEIPNNLFIDLYKISKTEVKKSIQKNYKKTGSSYCLSENISAKEYSWFDDILKFIRGTILGKCAINQTQLEFDFSKAIKKMANQYNIDLSSGELKNSLEEITVCILSILHEATFDLFDGTKAEAFISIGKKDVQWSYADGYELLLIANTGKLTFPIIGTNINCEKFIISDNLNPENWVLNQIPWNTTIRNHNNELKLISRSL